MANVHLHLPGGLGMLAYAPAYGRDHAGSLAIYTDRGHTTTAPVDNSVLVQTLRELADAIEPRQVKDGQPSPYSE